MKGSYIKTYKIVFKAMPLMFFSLVSFADQSQVVIPKSSGFYVVPDSSVRNTVKRTDLDRALVRKKDSNSQRGKIQFSIHSLFKSIKDENKK